MATEVLRAPLLVSIVLVGCGKPLGPPHEWLMEDGRVVSALMANSNPTVALVIDPGECLQCLGIIAEWLEWSRSDAGNFTLLLSRPPDDTERRILLTAGVPIDGTIVRGPPADSTPMELVFVKGRKVYSDAAIRRPTSPLLAKLRTQSLEIFVASIEPET